MPYSLLTSEPVHRYLFRKSCLRVVTAACIQNLPVMPPWPCLEMAKIVPYQIHIQT
jgi:hypothetical protein